jgi:hypothetical protein
MEPTNLSPVYSCVTQKRVTWGVSAVELGPLGRS